MDKIVFDIETKNDFNDVGGRDNLKDLEISVVCCYSYDEDKYLSFEEKELEGFGRLLQKSELLIGFNSKLFDLPVLEKYLKFNASAIPHFDIFEAVQKALGRRIGLGILAEANLGVGKSGDGLNAIQLYKQGQIEDLKKYCIQDVKITKDLYELIKKQGYVWIPERSTPQMTKLPIEYKEEAQSSQAHLL